NTLHTLLLSAQLAPPQSMVFETGPHWLQGVPQLKPSVSQVAASQSLHLCVSGSHCLPIGQVPQSMRWSQLFLTMPHSQPLPMGGAFFRSEQLAKIGPQVCVRRSQISPALVHAPH